MTFATLRNWDSRRSFALIAALTVLFVTLVPLTARSQENIQQGEICYDEVVEQLWERQSYQQQERERHEEWRWLREHKDVKGWEYDGGWVDRDNNEWYQVPASLIEAVGFDPRGIPSTGSVPLSVYGGPSGVVVQYQYVIEGPSSYTTDENSPYGAGSIKVDTRLSEWSEWTNVGDPFYADSPPSGSSSDTLQTRYITVGSLETEWVPVGETPDGEGWYMVDGETREVQVQVDCEPPPSGWVCDSGEVMFLDDVTGYQGDVYETENEAAADPDCQDAPVTVTVSPGACTVDSQGVPSGTVSITIDPATGATVEVFDDPAMGSENQVAATSSTDSFEFAPGTYYWTATAADGFDLGSQETGDFTIEDCTPPTDVAASIIVTVDSSCVVEGDQGQGVIDVVVSVDDGATVVIRNSAGDVVETLTSDGSVNVTAGATYTWEASPSDGFEFPPGFVASGSIDVEDCTPTPPPPPATPDEVLASILVTVDSFCDDGDGFVDVDLSVAGGATVVVSDSDGDVMGTRTADGTIRVPDGATYTWVATPSEGFEFPPGFDASGTISIESCSNPDTLPFTGMDLDVAAAFAAALLGAGITVLASQWRREEQ